MKILMIFLTAFFCQATFAGYEGTNCSRADNSMTCMVCNCFFEARGESYTGKVAIGRTVMTRIYTDQYEDRVCDTVYQHAQFSWTLDGISDRLPRSGKTKDYAALKECVKASMDAYKSGPNGYTHYHANYVRPDWATTGECRYKKTIGMHLFYDCYKWGSLALKLWDLREIQTVKNAPVPPADLGDDAKEKPPVPMPYPSFRSQARNEEAPVPMPRPKFRMKAESTATAIEGLSKSGQAELDAMAENLEKVSVEVKKNRK